MFGNTVVIFLRWFHFYYYVWIGIYSVWLVVIDIYPEVVKNIYSVLLLLGTNYVQIGSASSS